MILARREIQHTVERGEIRFDPPLDKRQWGDASVDLQLGLKFTKFKPTNIIIPLAKGIRNIPDALWHEETFPVHDAFGKRKSFCLEPEEFVLAQTYERIWIPRNLIARVEGRSTYARVGISVHETAPWLQPGWDGHITLEIRNSDPLRIELMPIDDMPCQVTFFTLTSELPEDEAYGSRQTDSFQHQDSPIPKK